MTLSALCFPIYHAPAPTGPSSRALPPTPAGCGSFWPPFGCSRQRRWRRASGRARCVPLMHAEGSCAAGYASSSSSADDRMSIITSSSSSPLFLPLCAAGPLVPRAGAAAAAPAGWSAPPFAQLGAAAALPLPAAAASPLAPPPPPLPPPPACFVRSTHRLDPRPLTGSSSVAASWSACVWGWCGAKGCATEERRQSAKLTPMSQGI